MAVGRYRDHFNRTILIAALERAADAGVIAGNLIKGGAAIELRNNSRRSDSAYGNMRYLGQPWATIDVDLAPSDAGNFATPVALRSAEMPAIATTARTMRTEFLIAQKIRAALTPDEPEYNYTYARHVFDVLFLARTEIDLDTVRAACHAVFALRSHRDGRQWPPKTIVTPDRWIGEYAATLNAYPDLDLRPEDVPGTFASFLTTRIGERPSMSDDE